VEKKVVIPPLSGMHVPLKTFLDSNEDFMILPCEGKVSVLTADVLVKGQKDMSVLVYNFTENYQHLKGGSQFGIAVEVSTIDEAPVRKRVRSISVPEVVVKDEEVPEHIKNLWEKSCANLDEEQREAVRKLLIEYEDVFAKNDSDIGCFTDIKHKIETHEMKPCRDRVLPLWIRRRQSSPAKEVPQDVSNEFVGMESLFNMHGSAFVDGGPDNAHTNSYCILESTDVAGASNSVNVSEGVSNETSIVEPGNEEEQELLLINPPLAVSTRVGRQVHRPSRYKDYYM
jgi:hypothetical protein